MNERQKRSGKLGLASGLVRAHQGVREHRPIPPGFIEKIDLKTFLESLVWKPLRKRAVFRGLLMAKSSTSSRRSAFPYSITGIHKLRINAGKGRMGLSRLIVNIRAEKHDILAG